MQIWHGGTALSERRQSGLETSPSTKTPEILGHDSGLAKSANKHNRLYFKAEPLDPELVQAIEEGQVGPKADGKEAAKLLTSKFGWDKQVPLLCNVDLLVDWNDWGKSCNGIQNHIL